MLIIHHGLITGFPVRENNKETERGEGVAAGNQWTSQKLSKAF